MTGKGDGVQHPRRFYKAVTVEPAEGGFAVRLDGRTPKAPGGTPLVLPTAPLAGLAAAEWNAQDPHVVMTSMPAVRLAWTALEKVGAAREAVAGEVARYAGSDLLCYRAEGPQELVAEQAAAWDPLLDWAAGLGVRLEPTAGIVHRPQPAQSLARVEALALALDDFSLTALAHAAGLLGSAVLALALRHGRIDGQAAHDLARLDEAWQERLWGVDAEAALRTEGRLTEALLLERWFAALRD
ncbi:MAG: ATP12 family protein [Caulobacter sp.]|nr:ATP12 family protein [Caulobacter sp.]